MVTLIALAVACIGLTISGLYFYKIAFDKLREAEYINQDSKDTLNRSREMDVISTQRECDTNSALARFKNDRMEIQELRFQVEEKTRLLKSKILK